MVFFKTSLKDIPREEIDTLEKTLDKLFYKGVEKNKHKFEHAGQEVIDEYKSIPFADIIIRYNLTSEKPVVDIKAKGMYKKGNFEMEIEIDMPENIYPVFLDTINKESPLISKVLPKPFYSSK